jgi:DNA (cytosine-5)-methyltransferase 1
MRKPGTTSALVVSLFSGAGGLDIGLEEAGFEIRLAVDSDPAACETLRQNCARGTRIWQGSIHDLSVQDMLALGRVSNNEIALLAGGPPCQPFSKAAFWRHGDTARLRDPRADTLAAYLLALRELTPSSFILENVAGLAFKGKDDGLQYIRRTVAAINRKRRTRYSFTVVKINAANFGVPQIRERIFVVGFRDGQQFIPPTATHADPLLLPSLPRSVRVSTLPWVTAWDAIGELQDHPNEGLEVRGYWGGLLPSIPEGSNYLFHTERGGGLPIFGWRRRYWSFLLKLAKDRPSWTIPAQPGPAIGPFHWSNRRLSMRELCRLQTFPDRYVVRGTQSEIQRQIGNAVPSLLGEVLGRAILDQLLGSRRGSDPPKLLIQAESAMPPPPARRRRVPRKYRALVGNHKPHPGTGKGPYARARQKM